MRCIIAFVFVYGFYIAPEGLAVPYAGELESDTLAVGLLMAADPIGMLIGSIVLTQMIEQRHRERLLPVLAVASGIPLILTAWSTSLLMTILLWVASGTLSSYTMIAQAAIIWRVPDHQRARVMGVVGAGLQASMGLGVLLAGAVTEAIGASSTVALFGAFGALGALAIRAAMPRPGALPIKEASCQSD